jgi:hypothetical protein
LEALTFSKHIVPSTYATVAAQAGPNPQTPIRGRPTSPYTPVFPPSPPPSASSLFCTVKAREAAEKVKEAYPGRVRAGI